MATRQLGLVVAVAIAGCRAQPTPAPVEIQREPSACDARRDLAAIEGDGSSSAIALARLAGRRVALLADEDDAALRTIDLETRELTTLSLPAAPGHVVVGRGRAYVAIPSLDTVLELAASNSAFIECRCIRAEGPVALAAAGDTLAIAGRKGLTVLRGSNSRTIALSRDPSAVLFEGEHAIVAHRVGSIMSVVSLTESAVAREVSFAWRDRVAFGSFPIADMPRFAVQAHALARVNHRVVAPLAVAYPGDSHLQLTFSTGYGPATVRGIDGYFPHEQALASIDATGLTPRLQLDREVIDVHKQRVSHGRQTPAQPGCLLPRAVAVDDGALVVACPGIDRLLVYRGDGDLLHAERARIAVPSGPVAIAADPTSHELVVWSQFARVLSTVSLSALRVTASTPVPAERARDAAWIEGRKTFHAPVGFDGRACASCHPDGREDGLVWSTPHGPLMPPVLAGRLDTTAPFGWLGGAANLHAHITETMHRLGAKPMEKATMDSLIVYLRAFEKRAPRPLDKLEKRGKELFSSTDVGCASCHQEGGSDGLRHDVGTGGTFDTPSLASVGTSAPYMHDGRFATLREAIALGTMGSTKQLGEADLNALVAYLKTL